MNAAFWAQLDARIARAGAEPAIADGLRPADAPNPPAPSEAPCDSGADHPSRPVADWSQILDTLSAASVAAQARDQRLRQQSTTCETLSADLEAAQQEIQTLRELLEDARAQAARQVHAIEMQADRRVQEAEARAEAATQRAAAAEDWLKRIEQASRDLLPEGRHAAA
ncbi:hypothetical protein MOTC310_10250 [Methylobacterium oryzae]|uniref:Uncharacterized protein n=1 Tax=Methylobacterium oryzae TaxID=334852 RepID=A0ABU7TMJ1_9HYPH